MKYVDDYNATIECAKKESWAEGWAESWTECRKETLAEVLSLWRQGYSPEEAEKMLSVAKA
jgi:hypothetical protein